MLDLMMKLDEHSGNIITIHTKGDMNVVAMYPIVIKTFHICEHKCEPHGGAKEKSQAMTKVIRICHLRTMEMLC